MSRCFPFPPPGYEKKPTTDDTNLLKKEKRKEKKHKKDKRDKEKKEGKEKREKDRSDGKQREKKDRKEKHRDKKKDKENDRDKDRDKGKGSTSEDKRVGEQLERCNGERVHPKEELGRERSNCSDDKKAALQYRGRNGEVPVRNGILGEDREDSRFLQELGRRIREEEKGTGSNHFVEGLPVMDWKKDDGTQTFAVGDIGLLAESKKDKRFDSRNMDGQRNRDEASFGWNTSGQNVGGMVQNKVEGPAAPLDKKMEKARSREREGDDKKGEKRKNKDRDKQRQEKDKDREKGKRKEEKAKEKSEQKKAEKDKIKHINKIEPLDALDNKTSLPSKNSIKNAAVEGNLKKRKETEINGFSHDVEPRPNKMPRPTSHLSTENGRKLEPCQNSSLVPSDKPGASANNLKVDNKEPKVNGIIVGHPLSVSTKKPLSSVTNQAAVQPLPASTTKPASAVANHIAAQPLPASITKPASAVANHIAAQPLPPSIPKPSPVVANQVPAMLLPVSIPNPSPAVANQVASKPLHVPTTKSSSASANQTAEASMKPPHPDTKHLSQILSVPKLEPWSDVDDQEWLFSSKEIHLKNPDMGSSRVDEELEVWAEARQLESVNVYALPYVIPY